MARNAEELPNGVRITNCISLGVVTWTFGGDEISRILASS